MRDVVLEEYNNLKKMDGVGREAPGGLWSREGINSGGKDPNVVTQQPCHFHSECTCLFPRAQRLFHIHHIHLQHSRTRPPHSRVVSVLMSTESWLQKLYTSIYIFC